MPLWYNYGTMKKKSFNIRLSPETRRKLEWLAANAHGTLTETVAIAIDETPLFFDARNPSSKNNKAISYILEQSRKRNTRIYLAAPRFKDIDIRGRLNYDKFTYVLPYKLRENIAIKANVQDIFNEKVNLIKVTDRDCYRRILYKYLYA